MLEQNPTEGKQGTARDRVFASSPISKPMGRPTEALSPSQGAFEALTRHHKTATALFFFRKLQLRSPEHSCYLQHPCLHLQLHDNIASFTSCLCHYLQGRFCWAVLMKLPVLQFKLKPRKYSAGLSQPYKKSHLLISLLEATQHLSSSHPYQSFQLHICTQLFSSQVLHRSPSLFSPDGHSGSPRTQKMLIFPFHYPSKQIYRGQKKKGRICFPLTCLLEKQIISVAPTSPGSRKQNVHKSLYKGCMSHYIKKFPESVASRVKKATRV